MTIWRLTVNEEFDNAFLIRGEKRNAFEANSVFCGIQPDPETRTIRLESGRNGFPDIMNYWGAVGSCGFIVSEKMKDLLENSFAGVTMQFIPCVCEGFPDKKVWIWNACEFHDLLDVEHSEYDTIVDLKGNTVIRKVEKYAFKPEAAKHDMFKIYLNGRPNSSPLFFTERFKDVMEQNGIKGFAYEKVCMA